MTEIDVASKGYGFPPGEYRERREEASVAAEQRLTAEQLAALTPGDIVTIEIAGGSRRPRRTAGTVVRVEGPHIVVTERSPRGVPYVEHYSRRDGHRVGRGATAQLVTGTADAPASSDERRRQVRIDAAYRAWARDRGNLEKLRELQGVIGDILNHSFV